ncbi:MAG: delta-60 repeat domain-containing protein [Actinomycetota bacterium]|nr:delta-60 repeat domain-containing protein [Actinomycetota bacterium]
MTTDEQGRIHAAITTSDGAKVRDGSRVSDYLLVRLRPDGRLDPSFSGNGMTLRDVARTDVAADIAVGPDGKTVMVGTSRTPGTDTTPPTERITVIRTTVSGGRDRSFSGDGIAQPWTAWRYAEAQAVAVLPNGKILVAGHHSSTRGDMVLIRLLPNGRLDRTFASDGKFVQDLGDIYPTDMTLDAQGRILLSAHKPGGRDGDIIAVARFLPGGRLDRTFGKGGVYEGGSGSAQAIAMQAERVLVVDFHRAPSCTLSRLTAEGDPDHSFGGGGWAGYPIFGRGLAVQRNEKIIVGGIGDDDDQFSVARLHRDGQIDRRFGNRGVASVTFGGKGPAGAGRVLIIGSRILAMGSQTLPDGRSRTVAAAFRVR